MNDRRMIYQTDAVIPILCIRNADSSVVTQRRKSTPQHGQFYLTRLINVADVLRNGIGGQQDRSSGKRGRSRLSVQRSKRRISARLMHPAMQLLNRRGKNSTA